jgi:hypothetical protein
MKRHVCDCCERRRYARFLEWDAALASYLCKDGNDCNVHYFRRETKEKKRATRAQCPEQKTINERKGKLPARLIE